MAEKDDRFKFAVTALTALVTLVSAIILDIKNNAVDSELYGYALLLTPVMVVSIFFFVAYVVIKGISIGAEESNKNEEEKIAWVVYSSAFLMFIIILLLISSLIFLVKYPESYLIILIIHIFILIFILLMNFRDTLFKKISALLHYKFKESHGIARKKGFLEKKRERFNNFKYIFKKWNIGKLFGLYLLLILIGFISNIVIVDIILTDILLGIFLYNYIIPKQFYPKQYVPNIVAFLFLLSSALWVVSISPISYFMEGQVTIDMNNIYYTNGSQIPVTIQLTGPNTGFSVDLSKKDNGSGLILVDSIPKLEPHHNATNVTLGDKSIIFGNSMENGKYNVFINTTNQRIGYYELNVTRYKYVKTSIKGFYLLDDTRLNTS